MGIGGRYSLNLDSYLSPARIHGQGQEAYAGRTGAWISRSPSTVSELLKERDFPIQLARLYTALFFAHGIRSRGVPPHPKAFSCVWSQPLWVFYASPSVPIFQMKSLRLGERTRLERGAFWWMESHGIWDSTARPDGRKASPGLTQTLGVLSLSSTSSKSWEPSREQSRSQLQN